MNSLSPADIELNLLILGKQIEALKSKLPSQMPLHEKVFEDPPDCNTKINKLLIFNEKKV